MSARGEPLAASVEARSERIAIAGSIATALAALDIAAIAQRYRDDGELVVIERALPDGVVAVLADEARDLAADEMRANLPGIRRAGTVPHRRLIRAAPLLSTLFRAPAVIELLAALSEAARGERPPAPTATANYYHYTRVGDRMRYHRDACARCDVTAQTVIFGIIDRSSQRLLCRLPGRELRVATTPGSMVVFNTARLVHAVSPLGAGEDRGVICASYSRAPRPSRLARVVAAAQEEVLYGGPLALVRSRWWS